MYTPEVARHSILSPIPNTLSSVSNLPSPSFHALSLSFCYHASLPFHSQELSISNFPSSLTRNIISHSMKNIAFHSLLRWKMFILYQFSLHHLHFSSKGLECLSLGMKGLKEYSLMNTAFRWHVGTLQQWTYTRILLANLHGLLQ